MFEKIKHFYEIGLYSKVEVHKFAEKGVISGTEYELITGEPYDEADTEASSSDLESALEDLGV